VEFAVGIDDRGFAIERQAIDHRFEICRAGRLVARRRRKLRHDRHGVAAVVDDLRDFGREQPRVRDRGGVDVLLMMHLPARGVDHHQQQRRRHPDPDQDRQSSSKAHVTFRREVMWLSAPVY
jgi:hypothetical protein